ncbi:glycoside hydrolase family 13 protein [Smaragdicoccus niigatensis]|uniref:glycoside hydrolase family 13 protein n=1 Tax=Smaragdicoccus niigatensis TaxID=359359 RepID=UPI0003644689|nr:glycoside hydrolase family 13 protein [Smaragdicoccus niigatensis]
MATMSWWSNAVFYQVYPRSFADSDGDGVGDLGGVRARLPYLKSLGIDAVWLCPVMRSPMADGGYDVSDPRDIDPLFGGIEALDELIEAAHGLSMRVVMDLVPNHTSDQHEWFQEALTSPPGSPERSRYIFRPGRAASEPPNNWPSIFGGPAWQQVPDGEWFMHIFAPEQPDLNWENPEVFADLEKTLRFWLDRGIDGFRIDVAHGMAKPPGLPDMADIAHGMLDLDDDDPRFNNPGVHAIHRKIRTVMNDYPDAVTIGEVWCKDSTRFGEYVRPDELHLAFNFKLAEVHFDAEEIGEAIENSLKAVTLVRANPTWTLSNHDIEREVTRYGGGAIGVARARAMMLLTIALPGPTFIYNGSELGLPNVDDLPEEVLQDPVWERSGHTIRGRDGCRVPLPWSGTEPPFGFTTGNSWLPMPPEWVTLTAEAQQSDPNSTFALTQAALRLRHSRSEFSGDLDGLSATDDSVFFRRSGGLSVLVNTGTKPIPLPAGEVLLASGPITDSVLPNTAVWLV